MLGDHPSYKSAEPLVESGFWYMGLRGARQPFGRGDKGIGDGDGVLSAPIPPQSLSDQGVECVVSRVYKRPRKAVCGVHEFHAMRAHADSSEHSPEFCVKEAPQCFFEIGALFKSLRGGGKARGIEVLHHAPKNFLFTWEVVVQRCAGNTCSSSNIGHARSLEAKSQERSSRAFQHPASTVESVIIVVAHNRHHI
jgi:hypothetical protein